MDLDWGDSCDAEVPIIGLTQKGLQLYFNSNFVSVWLNDLADELCVVIAINATYILRQYIFQSRH
jgi:putative N-acetylmannosamine-6-phosphate epimerase